MKIEISIGEALDRLSILEIKSERVKDEIKLQNILFEHRHLYKSVFIELQDYVTDNKFFKDLVAINGRLWDVEDAIRILEKQNDFGQKFVELARMVYILNDERAAIKKAANIHYKSKFMEEKSYVDYKKQ